MKGRIGYSWTRFLKFAVPPIVAAVLFGCGGGPPLPPRAIPDIEPARPTFEEGSLWPGETSKNMLFSDHKASKVGDVVTVHIVESATALNEAITDGQAQAEVTLNTDSGGGAVPTNIKLDGGSRFKGSGKTTRKDMLKSTVSALVVEVLPNGNLRIDGQRQMRVNRETQYLRVTGIIRPEDISFGNSILSSQIAEAEIAYVGAGDVSQKQKPGFGMRIMHKLWPF
jgi:flagellar L-ring protein precursor FlgH